MNLRQSVEGQFGPQVVVVLDAYAESLYEESCDYAIDRTDRRGLYKGQQLALKQQLIDLEGPIATLRIHVASTQDREELLNQIECFHDVDEELEQTFRFNLGVVLDSESSELFIHASQATAPAVIAELEAKYPGVRWVANRETLDLSLVGLCRNSIEARHWLKHKYSGK